MKIQIKNRFDLSVIFECEADSIKLAVQIAIREKANLRDANLRSADLRYDNLSYADLSGADLSCANLRGADLRGDILRGADLSFANLRGSGLSGANLRGADLSGADLSCANLRYADLSGADLSDANLRGADLSCANLSDANLRGDNLRYADLWEVKKDYFRILSLSKPEVVELYKSVVEGLIDGSKYEGDCSCLKGTIAKVRRCAPEKLDGLSLNISEPSEKFFLGIRKGDTPGSNPISAIVKEWTEEFARDNEIVGFKKKRNRSYE